MDQWNWTASDQGGVRASKWLLPIYQRRVLTTGRPAYLSGSAQGAQMEPSLEWLDPLPGLRRRISDHLGSLVANHLQ